MKARNRPPHIESRAGEVVPAPPPTPAEMLTRAKVAGPARMGASELRSIVDRLARDHPSVLGALRSIDADDVAIWHALDVVFGATPGAPQVDAERTLHAITGATARIAEVAGWGGQVAFATATPAAMFGLHSTLVRNALAAGARVPTEDDGSVIRVDGRHRRFVRWLDGVAAVTDGASLFAVDGPDAAEEWLFLLGRPDLVVADGVFAEVAWEAGLAVVAFVSLDRPALAVPASRGIRCCAVPVHAGRSPRAYAALADRFAVAFARLGAGGAPASM